MLAKTLMVQGTGSHVGKSVIVAALCRIFAREGYRVTPFKAQNMALNSFVTEDGKEMGRAQAVQAHAAGIEPTVDMNPILLKPQADYAAQVIVLGEPLSNMNAAEYHTFKPSLIEVAKNSLDKLRAEFDLVVIEGAGSPAEINLKEKDIANMKIAELAGAPVVLVGDIDKGGVFASFVGTLELLDDADKQRMAGFIINKFRGDSKLLEPGLEFLEEKTKLPVIGVVPYYRDIWIEEEDSVPLEHKHIKTSDMTEVEIAVIHLPHISNFTDFDALERERGVKLSYISSPQQLKMPDAVIVPGSKSTINDLLYLQRNGLAARIRELAHRGVPAIGICGGYQILGKTILDPHNIESEHDEIAGLGLLETVTTFTCRPEEPAKTTSQIEAETVTEIVGSLANTSVKGYEIHMGTSKLMDGARPAFRILTRYGQAVNIDDGAVSEDGLIWGTYIHGLFDNNGFRRNFINVLRRRKDLPALPLKDIRDVQKFREEQFDKLARLVQENLNMELVNKIVGLKNEINIMSKAIL